MSLYHCELMMSPEESLRRPPIGNIIIAHKLRKRINLSAQRLHLFFIKMFLMYRRMDILSMNQKVKLYLFSVHTAVQIHYPALRATET